MFIARKRVLIVWKAFNLAKLTLHEYNFANPDSGAHTQHTKREEQSKCTYDVLQNGQLTSTFIKYSTAVRSI